MVQWRHWLVLPILLVPVGCSAVGWKRLGYETLESWRQRQCAEYTQTGPQWAECFRRHSYEDYLRQRQRQPVP